MVGLGDGKRREIGIQGEVLACHVVEWAQDFRAPVGWLGPSEYFHRVLVEEERRQPSVKTRLRSKRYMERLYACLATWGLQRMQATHQGLVDYGEFVESVRSLAPKVDTLENLQIEELSERDFRKVKDSLRDAFCQVQVANAKWPLVANSKLLHHLLPRLVCPMDRAYTLAFFGAPSGDESPHAREHASEVFECVMRACWKAAAGSKNKRELQGLIGKNRWNTTVPKIIDNAIVFAVKDEQSKAGK